MVTVALSALATLLLTWLGLMALLLVARPKGLDLGEMRRFVPDVVRLIGRLARDSTLGWGPRARLSLLVAYLLSPIDLVPDFVPIVGYADDVIVIAVVLRGVVRRVGGEALERHWTGTDIGLAAVQRLAGLDGE